MAHEAGGGQVCVLPVLRAGYVRPHREWIFEAGRGSRCLRGILFAPQVATVYFKRRWFDFAPGDSVALAMLRAGQATVYDLKGAVYGDEGLAEYRRAEEEAQ